MTRRDDWRRARGAVAGITLLAAALPFIALAVDGVNEAGAAAAAAGVALLLAAAAVVLIPPSAAITWRDVRVPLGCFGLATIAGALRLVLPPAGQDLDADAVLIELVKIAGFAACAVTGLTVGATRGGFARWLAWLVHAGGAYTLVALAVAAPILVDPPLALAGRFAGTLANANASGCAFGVLALLALARVLTLARDAALYRLDARHLLALAAAAATAFFALGACAMSQSRVALLGTLALALILLVDDARRHRTRLVPLLLIGAGALATLAMLAVGDATAERFLGLAVDARSRWQVYRHLAGLVGEAPWLGHGLGSFIEVNVTHLTPDSAQTAWNWGAAHNIVLHGLIEGGLGVMLPILVLWSAVGVQVARRWNRVAEAPAVIAALVLILVCASVDIALNVPAVAMLASSMLGAVWGAALVSAPRAAAAQPRSAILRPDRASPRDSDSQSRHTS